MNIPPSLDFPPGRTTLTLQEIAKKLSCTVNHLIHFIEDGSLQAVNIQGPGAKRNLWRVPIESYRQFVTKRTS
jgi:hypothetical protein